MRKRSQNREILFAISDVGRLLRTYADHKARRDNVGENQRAICLQHKFARAGHGRVETRKSRINTSIDFGAATG